MKLSQKTKNIKSYLAHRLFFTSFFIVILPLIIYSIIFYISEKDTKEKDLVGSLGLLLDERAEKVDQIIDYKINALNYISSEMKDIKKEDTDNFLIEFLEEKDFQTIFILKEEGGNIICINASDKTLVNKVFSNIKEILDQSSIFDIESLCDICIYLSKKIDDNTYIIGSFLKEEIASEIAKIDYKYPIEVTIALEDGKIIASSTKNLNIFFKKDEKTYEMEKNYIGVNRKLKSSNLDLFLTVNKNIFTFLHNRDFFFRHVFLISILTILSVIITFILYVLFSKPITDLLKAISKVKEGDINFRYQKGALGFEMNELGAFFNEALDSIIEHQKAIDKEKAEKQRYIDEMDIARDIQLSMLPKTDVLSDKLDISYGYLPAKEVAGDFVDYYLKDSKLYFVIADIVGKGIPACLYSLNLRSIIRSYWSYLSQLDEIIINTNKLFSKDTKENFIFSTAFFGIIDIDKKVLTYSNAGHLPALIIKDNKITEITTDGKALGIEDIEKVDIKKIDLKKDEMIFLYTDGVVDAQDMNNISYNQTRLFSFFEKTRKDSSQEVIIELLNKLKNYSKNQIQIDDITALCIKIG